MIVKVPRATPSTVPPLMVQSDDVALVSVTVDDAWFEVAVTVAWAIYHFSK